MAIYWLDISYFLLISFLTGQIDLYHIPLAHVLTFFFYHTDCDTADIYKVLIFALFPCKFFGQLVVMMQCLLMKANNADPLKRDRL